MRTRTPPTPTGGQNVSAHAGGRPTKHPWAKIECLYVQGEDRERPGQDGRPENVREWPTQADLSKRFGLRPEQVYRRFATLGPDGRTAHNRRDAFKETYIRQLDDMKTRELVGREIRFRVATMALAELGLRQIALQLSRPQGADALLKLVTAAKRAQEVGMVALDRPANGPNGDPSGIEDWTLMREIRRGSQPATCLGKGPAHG